SGLQAWTNGGRSGRPGLVPSVRGLAVRRILFLAYHFPPIGGGVVQRNTTFARYLPDHGYDPVVLTGSGGGSGRWTPPDETLLAKIREETELHRVPGPEPAESEGWQAR